MTNPLQAPKGNFRIIGIFSDTVAVRFRVRDCETYEMTVMVVDAFNVTERSENEAYYAYNDQGSCVYGPEGEM